MGRSSSSRRWAPSSPATSLPSGWTVQNVWQTGGAATVSNGILSVDGASVSTDTAYGPGRSLEFVATFGAASFQHVGFASTSRISPAIPGPVQHG